MFYRETGQFKTSYAADMAVVPIRQGRIGVALLLAVAIIIVPLLGSPFFLDVIMVPLLVLSLTTIGLNILTGYIGLLSLGTGASMGVGALRLLQAHHRLPGGEHRSGFSPPAFSRPLPAPCSACLRCASRGSTSSLRRSLRSSSCNGYSLAWRGS